MTHHFADKFFKWFFSENKIENCILIQVLVKFSPLDTIGNKSALVQVMAFSWWPYWASEKQLITWANGALLGLNSLWLWFQLCEKQLENIQINISLKWMPEYLTVVKWTLVQVMAWCRQATSHYLNQYWPRYPTPYSTTRQQWVNVFNSLIQTWLMTSNPLSVSVLTLNTK